jgi:hypothetical protein
MIFTSESGLTDPGGIAVLGNLPSVRELAGEIGGAALCAAITGRFP